MSYFGTMIYIADRDIEDLIKELQGIKKAYKNKKVRIGFRVCNNECDGMHKECNCDVYSLQIEDK